MKKILAAVFTIVLSLVFIGNYNNSPQVIIKRLAKKRIVEQGALNYRLYLFGIFPVGEAVFKPAEPQIYEGKNVYHLAAFAQSLKVFSGLFSGSITLDSYLDTETLNPVLFKQKISISAKDDTVKEVFYDQEKQIMTIAGTERQIMPDTQDPLSAIFKIRQMDFSAIKSVELSLNTNQKNYIMKGAAHPRGISIGKGTYKTVVLSGIIRRRDKDNPYHRTNITVVLLQEKEENVPFLIKVFASGFFITARLAAQ